MNSLLNEVYFKGYDQSMFYIPIFHTIAKRFRLAMKLTNCKWNDNIYSLHVLRKFQQIKTGNHLEYVSSLLSQNSHLIYIQ